MGNLIDILEFHIAVSPDQLLYNLSLIKLCSACAKQNTALNASDACSLLGKETLSNLVGQCTSSLIINFEQVIQSFLVWNIYFTFFLPFLDCTFSLSTEE